MARYYDFPDPKDQSVNTPHRLVEREVVLALYNQANPDNSYTNLSETVRSWFEAEAKRQGWDSVKYVDQTAILVAIITLG